MTVINIFDKIKKTQNKSHYIKDYQIQKEISPFVDMVFNNQFYIHLIPTQTEKLLSFIEECNPKLGSLELSEFGLLNFENANDFSNEHLEQLLTQSKSSPFHFQENSDDFAYSQHLEVTHPEIRNYLMEKSNTNLSQLTSLLYAHALELFFDRYNETYQIDSDFKFYTKDEMRYGATKNNNQNVLKTLKEFPTIDGNNLEYFLQFWEDINFNKIMSI